MRSETERESESDRRRRNVKAEKGKHRIYLTYIPWNTPNANLAI